MPAGLFYSLMDDPAHPPLHMYTKIWGKDISSGYLFAAMVLPNSTEGGAAQQQPKRIKDLGDYLSSKTGDCFSFKHSILFNLIKKSGFTHKKKTLFSQKINDIRYDKAFLIVKFIYYDFKFIYLDESSFNINMEPIYGYSKRGEKFIIEYW